MKVDKSKSRTPGTIRRDSDFDINDRPKRESLSSSISRLPSISSRERRLQMTPRDRVNLYASEPLGIFDADVKESSDAPKMYIWDRLMKDELERIGAQPPNNPFEEMIRWTEQGKLWKYPIDNEQGMQCFILF
jgi:small subunit ribosomal protein S31